MEKFFKTGKAAKILGVSIRTLKRWAKKGILVPAENSIGGHNFYSESQISEFKNRDINSPDFLQKKAGDTHKIENRDKNRDIGEKTASE